MCYASQWSVRLLPQWCSPHLHKIRMCRGQVGRACQQTGYYQGRCLTLSKPLFKVQQLLGVMSDHSGVLTLEDMVGGFVGEVAARTARSLPGYMDHHHFPHC